MKQNKPFAVHHFLFGIAAGILLCLPFILKSTPTTVDSQSSLLADQVSEMESLINTFREVLGQSEQRVGEALTSFELSLASAAVQRTRAYQNQDETSSVAGNNGQASEAEFTAALPKDIRNALTVRGISPMHSPEILNAVNKAAEIHQAATQQALDALRSINVDFSQREATRQQITAIRIEQQKGAVEILCITLDDILK